MISVNYFEFIIQMQIFNFFFDAETSIQIKIIFFNEYVVELFVEFFKFEDDFLLQK